MLSSVTSSTGIVHNSFVPAVHNELAVFDSAEFGRVRVLAGEDGEPWFVASDVARALGYERPADAVNAHCKKVNKITQYCESPLSQPPVNFNIIPESDVYRLIMRSNLPTAERFQDWVVEEVLPSIRRHGVYTTEQFAERACDDPDWAISVFQRLKEERAARRLAEQTSQIEYERAEHFRRTKAEIGSQREATAMATASAAVRKVSALENRLGEGRDYKQVKAIPWLLDVFEESRAMYQQVGKRLKSMSERLGYRILTVPCHEYPQGVKAYHVEVVKSFGEALMTDLNMLGKYRKR